MNVEKGLELYKDLPRDEYFKKNQKLGKELWENEKIPTVFDIAQFMNGEDNEKMNAIFDFFDNKDEFSKMANRTHNMYDQDESSSFIKKVQAANCDEISLSGYFYKLLMASADDFRIIMDDCGSEGKEIDLSNDEEFTEENYNYYVKSMYVNEFGENSNIDYKKFKEKIKNDGIKKIHVRTPNTCKCAKNHGICKKCSGELPPKIKNIGTFTALCVTEHVTQGALSSMNKGLKQNINDALMSGYPGDEKWESIIPWIDSIVKSLENDAVQSRYYEISLLSRVRRDRDAKDGEENYVVASMKGSINYSGNIFGQYIFTPSIRNFKKIINKKHFEDNSLKLKIAMNNFEENDNNDYTSK